MRVLITGGGTAGHVNPALAIADIIQEREPDSVIEYVGTLNGIEGKLVPKKGMALHPITVKGLSRALSLGNVQALTLALKARSVCKKLIKAFSPDVVIGTGGYVCWPLISAAASMGVPTVLHESNAEPGFAVKTLRNKADMILINFDGTRAFLQKSKAKVERVGMPVDRAFYSKNTACPLPFLADGADNEKSVSKAENNASRRNTPSKRILSFGGSLGAQTVNECALRLMKEYVIHHPEIEMVHACGARAYESVKVEFVKAGLDCYPNLTLSEYIYDMPERIRRADLVICRSGASTLAELAAAGKAAILIPSPNVTGDQQRKNAYQLSQKNAALVLEDDIAPERIVAVAAELLNENGKRQAYQKNVRDFALIDCDDRIYRAINSLVTQG